MKTLRTLAVSSGMMVSVLALTPVMAAEAPPPSAVTQDAASVFDLDTLYQAALVNSPALKAAAAGSDAANDTVRDAYFGFLPRLSLSFDHQREYQRVNRTDNPVYQVGRGRFSNFDRNIQLVQPVVDARLFAQLHGAEAGASLAQHQVVASRQKFIYSVIEAYVLALAAVEDLRLSQSEVQALEGHSREIELKMRSGVGSRIESSDINARIEKSRADVIVAEHGVLKAFANLRRVSGQQPVYLRPLADHPALPLPSPAAVEEWIQAAHQYNPDALALQDQIDQAKAGLEKSEADLLPRVEAVASSDRMDSGGSLYGGGALTHQDTLSVRLVVPVFNAEGQGYQAFSASARLKQARYNRDDKLLDLDEKVRTAFFEATKNAKASASLNKAAEFRATYAKDVQAKFKSGVATVTDLLDSERDAFRARREELSSQYNYLLNMMALKQFTSGLSEDDVHYLNGLLAAGASTQGL